MGLPYLLEQSGTGDGSTAIDQQIFEQRKFLSGKRDRLAAACDAAVDAVDFDRSVAQGQTGAFVSTAAPERVGSGTELRKCKGLEHAIIGAEIETADTGFQLITAAEDKDG